MYLYLDKLFEQTGLLFDYESNSTAKCYNIPAHKKDAAIYSIKTDTCLMVYYYPNCQGYISRKFDLENMLVF